MRKALSFVWMWLLVGYVSGTGVLLGPLRWVTDLGRDEGWSEATEGVLVRCIITVYVVGSALLALVLTRVVYRTRQLHVKIGLPALVLLAAVAHLWLWLTPDLMAGHALQPSEAGSRFTFGPYPGEARLQTLRDEGYSGVISLLHPAVVPFETALIREGRAAARRAGLEYVHVPMLPWVSDNTEALERIRGIVASGEGRYYVHCYLGKDRIRLVKRLVAEADPAAGIGVTRSVRAHENARQLTGDTRFTRGEVLVAVPEVYLTPFPTDDEFLGFILPGTHGDVVSLLDPDNEQDLPWIEKEAQLLEGNGMALTSLPISVRDFDPHRALEVARTVARMQRPVVVHAFLSVGSGRSPAAEAFLQAVRSDLPPLPPSLFVEPMSSGPVTVVGPNLAVGPRPGGEEFAAYLHRRGVREFLYLGEAATQEAREDRRVCAEASLAWRAVDPDVDIDALVAEGGPWYLYGPGLSRIRSRLVARHGPAIPGPQLPVEDAELRVAGAEGLRLFPSAPSAVLLGPWLALFTACAAAFVASLHRRGLATPYSRKVFHFLIFTAAGALHFVGGLPLVTLFGAIVSVVVLYAVWRGSGQGFYEAIARPSDAPRRGLFVIVPLATTAIGGLAANLLFGTFAYVGYLVAGWGDAIAEPIGTAWGRHRYRVPSLAGVAAYRSLEGSLSVCLVGALAAFLGLWLGGVSPPAALGVALASGLAGALVEAFSNHGLDNLTVQLAASGTAFLLLT